MENIYVHKTDTHELTAVNYHMIDEIITSIAQETFSTEVHHTTACLVQHNAAVSNKSIYLVEKDKDKSQAN